MYIGFEDFETQKDSAKSRQSYAQLTCFALLSALPRSHTFKNRSTWTISRKAIFNKKEKYSNTGNSILGNVIIENSIKDIHQYPYYNTFSYNF